MVACERTTCMRMQQHEALSCSMEHMHAQACQQNPETDVSIGTVVCVCTCKTVFRTTAPPPVSLLLLPSAHLQALRVERVASIFSMGGHWPLSSICVSTAHALRQHDAGCCQEHVRQRWPPLDRITFSTSAALMPRVSSSFFTASFIVVAFAMAVPGCYVHSVKPPCTNDHVRRSSAVRQLLSFARRCPVLWLGPVRVYFKKGSVCDGDTYILVASAVLRAEITSRRGREND